MLVDKNYSKHEVIACERCGNSFECKANSSFQCQCNTVQLSINEMQFIAEQYEGCLCAACLSALQKEYLQSFQV